jgi:arylsulfatase A-like enzyme
VTSGAALALAGCAVAGLALVLSSCAPSSPPRIVLIVVDTLRSDYLSPYGSSGSTPNIAALAERGQVFHNVVASFHQTSMSMTALFTGRTPSIESGEFRRSLPWNGSTWCGLARFGEGSGEESECIPESLPTLAGELRRAGYWTIGVASNHFLFEPSGFGRGFDDWVEVGTRPTGSAPFPRPAHLAAAASRNWKVVQRGVVEALGRRRGDRFFLFVHYMDVHDHGESPAHYGRAVAVADRAIGELLRSLEQSELLDGSVVIVTSDHGEKLGERHALDGGPGHLGNPSFQEVLRVPLIVAPPVLESSDPFRRTEDLFYLIQEIAGLSPDGASDLEPGELYVGERKYRTYLRGRWKSTRSRKRGDLYLFDLESDAGERRNVADAHPDVVEVHRRRVDELSLLLSAESEVRDRELSSRERARLEALGYLEGAESPRSGGAATR